jgi:hypothetical protein
MHRQLRRQRAGGLRTVLISAGSDRASHHAGGKPIEHGIRSTRAVSARWVRVGGYATGGATKTPRPPRDTTSATPTRHWKSCQHQSENETALAGSGGFLHIPAKSINPEKTLWNSRMLESGAIAEQRNLRNRAVKRQNRKSLNFCDMALTVDFRRSPCRKS